MKMSFDRTIFDSDDKEDRIAEKETIQKQSFKRLFRLASGERN
jgi:hypothetical protein